MARDDLLALTDDGLTQLSNAGIVKRSRREIEAGTGPEKVTEQDDGSLLALFSDGTQTRLAPGQSLADASCTCPSSGVCRHRIMLAMAWREKDREKTGDAADIVPAPESRAVWTPASLDLEGFEAALRPAEKAELARLLGASHSVRLEHENTPAAHLPMATVRFLVPGDISYARCDCAQAKGCLHIALAIRAFQAAEGRSETVLKGTARAVAKAPEGLERLREAADRLLGQLLRQGATAGRVAHARTTLNLREQAEAMGAVQMLLAVDALQDQIEGYEARSARYSEHALMQLAVGIFARPRARDTAFALGLGEPFETRMTKSRLVSLGSRLIQEGSAVRAKVLVADSDTGSVMILEKLFAQSSGAGQQDIRQRQMGSSLPLANVARGQILSSVARRRADGLLLFGSGAAGRTQVMPRDALFHFPPPLVARSVQDVIETLSCRPLSLIEPQQRIRNVHIFDVDAVLGQSWSPGDQYWQAAVRLKDDGGVLYLERAFDSGAKGAISVLSATLKGRNGPLRQITGTVRMAGGALICDPWSLAAERFIVPDLDPASTSGDQAAAPVMTATSANLLDETGQWLAGCIHGGERVRDATGVAMARQLVSRLKAAGFRHMAEYLESWLASPNDPEAFAHAAIWLLAMQERSEN